MSPQPRDETSGGFCHAPLRCIVSVEPVCLRPGLIIPPADGWNGGTRFNAMRASGSRAAGIELNGTAEDVKILSKPGRKVGRLARPGAARGQRSRRPRRYLSIMTPSLTHRTGDRSKDVACSVWLEPDDDPAS